ncbi:hypothetical protein ACMGDK_11535 [Chryseobacterium sp. DT-3]|uniref:hypothetical protein n=1 Tax=Chryseobacterium sp. DT-3 TaxID=3396164 RepID=UPI003F1A60EE
MKYEHYLYSLILHLKSNPTEFAKSIGYTRADRIYNVLKMKNNISSELANDIVLKYPDVVYEWLMTGEGDMLKVQKYSSKNKNTFEKLSFENFPNGKQLEVINSKLDYLIKADSLNKIFIKTLLAKFDLKIEMFESNEKELDELLKSVIN